MVRVRPFRKRFVVRLLVVAVIAGLGYRVAPRVAAPAAEARGQARPARSAGLPPAASHSDNVALRRAHLPGPYPIEVLDVLDGDTIEARVRVWFGQEITTLVRLRGIDAPELKARCGDELRGARAARDTLAGLLTPGRVSIGDVALDKYGGRVVATLLVDEPGRAEPLDVANAMLAAGMARPYTGGRRDNWCPAPGVARG